MPQEYIKVKGVAYSRSIPKNERLTKKQIQQGLESIIGKKKKVARIFKPFLKKLVPMTLEEDLEWMEKFTAWRKNLLPGLRILMTTQVRERKGLKCQKENVQEYYEPNCCLLILNLPDHGQFNAQMKEQCEKGNKLVFCYKY